MYAINPYNADFVFLNLETKVFFQFEIVINDLVSSSGFI